MIFKAIEFAAQAHSGQFRKGSKVPYIIHPLQVAKILIDLECPEAWVVAGILHDTIEDTKITFNDILEQFGLEIAQMVEAESEPDRSAAWEDRKQHTIQHLAAAPKNVLLIALADKLDNIRTIHQDYLRGGERIWERFNRPRKQQCWYYQSLAGVFQQQLENSRYQGLADEFLQEVQAVFLSDGK